MKLKPRTVTKRCEAGEMYKFKRGVATVPNFWMHRKPVLITLKEFNNENIRTIL